MPGGLSCPIAAPVAGLGWQLSLQHRGWDLVIREVPSNPCNPTAAGPRSCRTSAALGTLRHRRAMLRMQISVSSPPPPTTSVTRSIAARLQNQEVSKSTGRATQQGTPAAKPLRASICGEGSEPTPAHGGRPAHVGPTPPLHHPLPKAKRTETGCKGQKSK